MKKRAIIFAAGQGKRFNLNQKVHYHKSLILILGKTLIEHIIDYLLTIKGLDQIVILTGYKTKLFQFLTSKYSKVQLIFNSCFKNHKTACALWKVKDYLLDVDLLFLIAGDMICYQNYFKKVKNINAMSAIYRNKVLIKQSLSYQLDDKQEIIGFQINQKSKVYSFGEFSVIQSNWVLAIADYLSQNQKNLVNKEVYEVLIESALQNQIKIKVHLLSVLGPSDVDYQSDWEEVLKILTKNQLKSV